MGYNLTIIIIGILREIAELAARMAPYLVLGFAVAGALRVIFPVSFVVKHLGRRGFSSVLKAAALGVPLPLCSCGVIGPAAALRAQGASRGAVLSFLVSTPTTGVDSILATYGLLGLPFTIYRLFASFFLGLISGGLANIQKDGALVSPDSKLPPCSVCGLPGVHNHGFWERFKAGLVYATLDLPGDIGRWLILGLVVAGLISYIVDPSWIAGFAGKPFIAYPVMVAVAVPLYVCATGSIPIAAALMAKGVSPGAALVFLVAGPATNAITIGIVAKLLGKRSLFIYLLTIIAGSILLGLAMDWMNTEPLVPIRFHHIHEASHIRWWEWVFGAVLSLLLLYALVIKPVFKWLSAMATKPDMVFRVPDMTCEHCVSAIESRVSKVDGVKGVWVSLDKKTVSVKGGDKIEVEKAIRSAGYSVENPDLG
ncbi:MAG: SO_0444 family Cu/Zn efflux transporter [candidate division WOR-3 bacterium]